MAICKSRIRGQAEEICLNSLLARRCLLCLGHHYGLSGGNALDYEVFIGISIPEIQANISFSSFLNFVLSTLLAFGTIFELPIVMFLLTKFGIVRSSFYTKYRKYMILIIFIVAAILTPPDVVSQVLMALPMLLLYEIGIVFSKFGQKKKENI